MRTASACSALCVQCVVRHTPHLVRHDCTDFTRGSVIIMGNEQSGLPAEAEAACDQLCLIPMRGGADSLNLAQATAIMTYEAWRQRDFT